MLWEKVTVIGFTLLLQFGLLAVIDHDGPGLSWWIWLPGSHRAVLEVSCWETTKAARPDVSAGAPAVVCSARQSAPSSSRVWRTHDSGLSVICWASPGRTTWRDPAFPARSLQRKSWSSRNSQDVKRFRDYLEIGILQFASNTVRSRHFAWQSPKISQRSVN